MAGFGNGRGSMPLLRGSTPCHATKSFECRKADLPMEEKSEARRAVSSPQHSRTGGDVSPRAYCRFDSGSCVESPKPAEYRGILDSPASRSETLQASEEAREVK